jgi:thiol:disulfide interchange protein DsbD
MRILALFFFFVFAGNWASAGESPLPVDQAFQFSVDRTSDGELALHWRIAPGYYLYRRHLLAAAPDGAALQLSTPAGILKQDENFGTLEVYHDAVDATLARAAKPVTVTYQGCQERGLCYPPVRRIVDPSSLSITDLPLFRLPLKSQSAWNPADTAETATTALSVKPSPVPAASSSGDEIVDRFLARGGVPFLLVAFFGFGILLALTPCVFPLYPILAATLTRQGEQLSARRGFLMSVSYALGLALAFAILGAVAGWTGENLQIALQSPLTVAAVAAIFAILALSMFGLFELQLPSSWVTAIDRMTGGRKGSFGSSLVLGFSSALIVGPCVTAPLAGALLYVARTGDVILGTAALFALGLGKGVPLVIFGTVGSQALPRAGVWMTSVKHLFGYVFFAFAIWLAEPVLPDGVPLGLWALWAMAVAVFLGAFDVTKGRSTPMKMGFQSLGLLAAVYSVILVVGLTTGASDPLRPLDGLRTGQIAARLPSPEERMQRVTSASDLDGQLDAARRAGKASLIYFTADWCVSCRSLDRNVFSRRDVAEALSPLATLKIDLTDIGPGERELMGKLGVVGPPTMVFYRPDRAENGPAKLVGEFGADDLLRAVRDARNL